KAIDALGSLPGTDVQQHLAAIALDTTADKKLRHLAAFKLHQHILKHTLVLNQNQIDGLRKAHLAAATDPALHKQLSLVVSVLPKTFGKPGPKLGDFTPKPVK